MVTFCEVPQNSTIVYWARYHVLAICWPAQIIDIFQMTPGITIKILVMQLMVCKIANLLQSLKIILSRLTSTIPLFLMQTLDPPLTPANSWPTVDPANSWPTVDPCKLLTHSWPRPALDPCRVLTWIWESCTTTPQKAVQVAEKQPLLLWCMCMQLVSVWMYMYVQISGNINAHLPQQHKPLFTTYISWTSIYFVQYICYH